MDERLKKLLEWLQRNQSGNPYAKEMPFHPWGKKGIKPVPFPDWPEVDPDRVKPVPMPGIGGDGDLPEYDPESEWYNPNWREEREKNLPEGHLLHLIPPSQAERYRKRFNLDGMMKPKWTPEQVGGTLKNPKWTPGQGGGTLKNVGEDPTLPRRIKPGQGRVSNLPEKIKPTPAPDFWKKRTPYFPRGGGDWEQLLNKAQVGSAMYGRGTPSYHPGNRRENMMIPPGKRKRYPAEFDPATGQNRVVPGTLKTSYPNEERMRGPQLGGVPEGDRKFVDTMHNIQNAYFTGADFGYEEGWPEQLGASQEQIDMFMAVPEEAIRHAMENPTDAVLQQFEEYYGFPLNVNDPDMQKYFEDRKKKR